MKSLPEAITNFNTLHSAFTRVAENHGCRGSDGVTIELFERELDWNLQELQQDLRNQNYHPFPLMRFAVPKRKAEGVRHLSVPTVRDRVAQAAAYLATKDIFEKEFDKKIIDMLIIISYDITDDKKRTKLAKKLKDFGPRVQKSVFEADVEPGELKKLKRILARTKLDKQDSIRLYRICDNCRQNIKIWGSGEVTEDKDFYIA